MIKDLIYDIEVNTYLDTKSNVLIINQRFVFEDLETKCSSIIMKEMCNMQTSKYYVNVKILLNNKATKIEISIKIYIIAKLLLELILKINFLKD